MIFLSLCFLGSVFGSDADTECDVTWNVEERWGITYQGLNLALDEAQALLFIQSDSRVCFYLAPGIHRLPMPEYDSSIDLSGLWGSGNGRLVLQGAGMEA
jgi:hypothetical protein